MSIIKAINIIFIISLFSHTLTQQPFFLLMLAPAGDAKQVGRTIGDNFERGITLQYAEELKHLVETTCPTASVIVSRSPGDIVPPLQHASFANRLRVNLFISIHFYHTTAIKPDLHIYQFSYNDDFVNPSQTLSFYPYDQAHLFNKKKTSDWTQLIKNTCQKPQYQKLFTAHDIHTLPFKPLIGVTAPAIGIEAGLKNKIDWIHYLEPIKQAITAIIENCS